MACSASASLLLLLTAAVLLPGSGGGDEQAGDDYRPLPHLLGDGQLRAPALKGARYLQPLVLLPTLSTSPQRAGLAAAQTGQSNSDAFKDFIAFS